MFTMKSDRFSCNTFNVPRDYCNQNFYKPTIIGGGGGGGAKNLMFYCRSNFFIQHCHNKV